MYMFYDLTDRFPMKLDVEKMRSELESLEGSNWLSHYDKALADGWTTIPLATHDGSCDNEESQHGMTRLRQRPLAALYRRIQR